MFDANRAVIICKPQIIMIRDSIFSFFCWARVAVLHADFMPIVRCLGHFSTLCVHVGANSAWSYGFNSTPSDKTTDTGSTVIYGAGWLSNAWVHHAPLTHSIIRLAQRGMTFHILHRYWSFSLLVASLCTRHMG